MAEILTKRNKPIKSHDGFLYTFDRRGADNGKFWRCMNSDCTGRLDELKPMITTFSSSLEMLEELHKGVTRNSSQSRIGCHS